MSPQTPKIAPSVPFTTAGKSHEKSGKRVVHESEVQRQHARVRMPGIVEVGEGPHRARFKLYDLSASGCSFDAQNHFKPGDSYRANLILNVDQVALTFAVTFVVRSVSGKGRVGATFENLGQREISALRHLITSYLSGDLVNVGEVLHTMQRDNFAGARGGRDRGRIETQGGGFRAALMSLFVLGAGVLALGYAAIKLHEALFVSNATAAKVAGPVYSVTMPREGTFFSLVPPDGVVKKGAAIASYEAPVLDLVRSHALNANLTPEQIERMLKQTVKGTITSPCDCRVQTQFVADAQFVNRGQQLFELIPRQFKSFVVARFPHDKVADLSPGTTVQFRIAGDGALRTGTISQLRVPGMEDELGGGVIAMVEPNEPLPNDLVNLPAEVSVGGLHGLPGLFNPTETATAKPNGAL